MGLWALRSHTVLAFFLAMHLCLAFPDAKPTLTWEIEDTNFGRLIEVWLFHDHTAGVWDHCVLVVNQNDCDGMLTSKMSPDKKRVPKQQCTLLKSILWAVIWEPKRAQDAPSSSSCFGYAAHKGGKV